MRTRLLSDCPSRHPWVGLGIRLPDRGLVVHPSRSQSNGIGKGSSSMRRRRRLYHGRGARMLSPPSSSSSISRSTSSLRARSADQLRLRRTAMTDSPLVPYRVPRSMCASGSSSSAAAAPALLAFLVILIMVCGGLLADLVAPYDPATIDFEAMPRAVARPIRSARRVRPRRSVAHHLRALTAPHHRLPRLLQSVAARLRDRRHLGLFPAGRIALLVQRLSTIKAVLPAHHPGARRRRRARQGVVLASTSI